VLTITKKSRYAEQATKERARALQELVKQRDERARGSRRQGGRTATSA
jgi:hypothetical protein